MACVVSQAGRQGGSIVSALAPNLSSPGSRWEKKFIITSRIMLQQTVISTGSIGHLVCMLKGQGHAILGNFV